jgi:hypothetical protein
MYVLVYIATYIVIKLIAMATFVQQWTVLCRVMCLFLSLFGPLSIGVVILHTVVRLIVDADWDKPAKW